MYEKESLQIKCKKVMLDAIILLIVDDYDYMIQWLIDHGADVNAKNNKNETPLDIAALRGNFLIIFIVFFNFSINLINLSCVYG